MPHKGKFVDKHPQVLRLNVTETAANTFTQALPVQTPIVPERNLVMNIIRVFLDMEDGGIGENDTRELAIYDQSRTAMPEISDAGVLIRTRNVVHITTSGIVDRQGPAVFDFTDGQGNGVLYGRKQIFIAVEGGSQSIAMIAHAMIEYTLTEVSDSELVGMLA